MKQLDKYNTFIDIGKNRILQKGYKKIKVHHIYNIKHDTRHKARCVADGHLAEIPLNNVYYGVASLLGLHMMIFLIELDQLDTWATDIGNAYLEVKTSEKVYITAGQEFEEKQSNTLLIYKVLYCLRSSRLRWHDFF